MVTLLPHAGDPMRQTGVLCKCALSEREVPLSICVTAGGHMVPVLMQAGVVARAIYFAVCHVQLTIMRPMLCHLLIS